MKPTYWLFSIAEEVERVESLNEVELLGASPSEMDHNDDILAEQGWPWIGHQGCPEMQLDWS